MATWQPHLVSLVKGALFASSIRANHIRPFLGLVERADRATRPDDASAASSTGILGAGAAFPPEARSRIEQTAGEVYRTFSPGERSSFEAEVESIAARAGTREDLEVAWRAAFQLVDRLLRHRDLSALLIGARPFVVVHPTGRRAGDGTPIEVRVPLRVGRPVVVGRKPDEKDRGASTDVDLPIDAGHVSRRHCELHLLPDGQIRVVDTSSHGTFVGDRKIHRSEGPARLGEPIGLGHASTTIHVAEEDSTVGATVIAPREPPPTVKVGADGGQGPTRADANSTGELPIVQLPLPDAPSPPPTGELCFGRYSVVREIGRGGMGVVYEAIENGTRRRCALKLLLGGGRADKDLIARFAREALIGKKLGVHPGIVCAFDMGTAPDTGEIYYAMDYVDGGSFGEALRAGLARTAAVPVVVKVARAVAHAHDRGVIHRDLKPDNVLLTRAGEPRVMDFGLAKALDEGNGMTATGVAMGTPNFMPPEQVEDAKRVGPLADVYALGGILYLVLTGDLPYVGKGIREVFANVMKGMLKPPRRTDPSISPALEELCCRALSRDPKARPPSALAFAEQLERRLAEVVD